MIEPAVSFVGVLVDRSSGRYNLGAPSSKELMERFPEWPAFIRSITGWERVEPGTLTLERVEPIPLGALENVVALGTEPADLFVAYDSKYARFLRERRGTRRFYGAVARAGERRHVATVSQQERPASSTRLEVYSNERLRDVLGVRTGDKVEVDVFHRDDWVRLTAASV